MCLFLCMILCIVTVCFATQEASISWEKRQAEVRAKLQQEADANAWTSWWDNVTGKKGGGRRAT